MSNRSKRTDKAACAVVINANIRDFRKGTRDKADRLVEALRPITDKWYLEFSKASIKGSDEVLETYRKYRETYIATQDHTEDEIFRYTALAIILRSVHSDSYLDPNVSATTSYLLTILFSAVCSQVEHWFPRQRFEEEIDLFDYAQNIDSLGLEYNNVGK